MVRSIFVPSQLEVFQISRVLWLGTVNPYRELAYGNKLSREVPSHLIYSLPKFEPVLWWARFISSLFLYWGGRDSQLYVNGGANAYQTPCLVCSLALSSVACVLRGCAGLHLCEPGFSKGLRQKPVSVLWISIFIWSLVSDYFLLSWKLIDSLKKKKVWFLK